MFQFEKKQGVEQGEYYDLSEEECDDQTRLTLVLSAILGKTTRKVGGRSSEVTNGHPSF